MTINPMQRAHAAPRCKAKSKRTGKQCRAPAVRGWKVCLMHGARGGAPRDNATEITGMVRARRKQSRFGSSSNHCGDQYPQTLLPVDYRADRLMPDTDWVNDITPDEAQQVLEKLAEHFSGGMTAREAFELHKVRPMVSASLSRACLTDHL